MNSIQKSQLIVKVRANLYQLPYGQLVGFGPLESENGISTCWTCFEPECEHVEAITQAWLGGMSVEAHSIPFDGIAPEVEEWADDYALSEATL